MFQEWGFLIGEIWFLLLLAALIGLLAGWIIWGRSSNENSENGNLQAELDRCKDNLQRCRDEHADKDARIAALTATPASNVAFPVETIADEDFDGDGVVEGSDEGSKPSTLDGPRGGQADDLKRIKGVGPKMETMLHGLGFYHFDQVANWTDDEVAWVDANLEGFKGRVSRDNWVSQAQLLASGGETEFSKKVDDGDVY